MALGNSAKAHQAQEFYTVTETRQYVRMYVGIAFLDLLMGSASVFSYIGKIVFEGLIDASFIATIHLFVAWHHFGLLRLAKQVNNTIQGNAQTKHHRFAPWTMNFDVTVFQSFLISPWLIVPLLSLVRHATGHDRVFAFIHFIAASLALAGMWFSLYLSRSPRTNFGGVSWREKACSVILSLPKDFVREATVQEFWFALGYCLEKSCQSESRNEQLVNEIYAFAEWCLLNAEQEFLPREARQLISGVKAFYRIVGNSPFAKSALAPSKT